MVADDCLQESIYKFICVVCFFVGQEVGIFSKPVHYNQDIVIVYSCYRFFRYQQFDDKVQANGLPWFVRYQQRLQQAIGFILCGLAFIIYIVVLDNCLNCCLYLWKIVVSLYLFGGCRDSLVSMCWSLIDLSYEFFLQFYGYEKLCFLIEHAFILYQLLFKLFGQLLVRYLELVCLFWIGS